MIGIAHLPTAHRLRRRPWIHRLLAGLIGLAAPGVGLAAEPTAADTLGKPRVGALHPVASPMADPTRPPGLASVAAGASGVARGIQGTTAPAAAEPPPPAVLQSVHLPDRGMATAVVDGRLVRIGDTVDGAIVSSIDAQGLVLRTARGEHRKWLLGGPAKQAVGTLLLSRSTHYLSASEPMSAASAPAGKAMVGTPETDRSGPLHATPTTAKATPSRPNAMAGSN